MWCGVITEFLAADIESLSNLTTQENPLYLRLVETQIIASIGENDYLLFEYPENMPQSENIANLCTEESVTIINAKQSANISLNLHNVTATRTAQRASITIDKNEQQGANSWCTAYALSAIIRTRTSYTNIYAKDCMRDAYGYVPSTSTKFPRSKISSVASGYGLNPTVSSGLVSDSILYSQIEAGRPILLTLENFGGTSLHDVVLRSYSLTNSTWGIWNPWFDFYEWYSMSGTYIPTGYSATNEHTYLPYRHAYNF